MRELEAQLKCDGVLPWVDQSRIHSDGRLLRQAIDEGLVLSGKMLVILSDSTWRRPDCRQEWHKAFQLGLPLIIANRAGPSLLAHLPAFMRSHLIADIAGLSAQDAHKQLIEGIRKPFPSLTQHNLPSLPDNHVEDDGGILFDLHAALFPDYYAPDGGNFKKAGVLLHGPSGAGKTALAAYLGRMVRMRRDFDLILWLPAKTWQFELNKCRESFGNFELNREMFLRRRVLVILDDLHRRETLVDLQNLIVDSPTRLLVTSQHRLFADEFGLHSLPIPQFSGSMARQLLFAITSRLPATPSPPMLYEIIDRAQGLPLVISLIGALISNFSANRKANDDEAWLQVALRLRRDGVKLLRGIEKKGANYRSHAIDSVLSVVGTSLRQAKRLSKVRGEIIPQTYGFCGAFPKGARIPIDLLIACLRTANLSEKEIDESLNALFNASLLYGDGNHVWLHDLQSEYASTLNPPFKSVATCLAQRDSLGNDDESAYLFARLPWHLAMAGNQDQLSSLLDSFEYLEARILAGLTQQVISDFQLSTNAAVLEVGLTVKRFESALLASPRHWPAILYGHVSGECAGFTDKIVIAMHNQRRTWLRASTRLNRHQTAVVKSIITTPLNAFSYKCTAWSAGGLLGTVSNNQLLLFGAEELVEIPLPTAEAGPMIVYVEPGFAFIYGQSSLWRIALPHGDHRLLDYAGKLTPLEQGITPNTCRTLAVSAVQAWSVDGVLGVLDTRTQKIVVREDSPKQWLLASTPAGFAVEKIEKGVRVWNLHTSVSILDLKAEGVDNICLMRDRLLINNHLVNVCTGTSQELDLPVRYWTYILPDLRHVVIVGGSAILYLDSERGELRWQVELAGPLWPLAIDFKKKLIYAGGGNSAAAVHSIDCGRRAPYCIDLNSGAVAAKLTGGHSGPVCAIAVLPDGSLATATASEVRILKPVPGRPSPHVNSIRQLLVSGDLCISIDHAGVIAIWDVGTGALKNSHPFGWFPSGCWVEKGQVSFNSLRGQGTFYNLISGEITEFTCNLPLDNESQMLWATEKGALIQTREHFVLYQMHDSKWLVRNRWQRSIWGLEFLQEGSKAALFGLRELRVLRLDLLMARVDRYIPITQILANKVHSRNWIIDEPEIRAALSEKSGTRAFQIRIAENCMSYSNGIVEAKMYFEGKVSAWVQIESTICISEGVGRIHFFNVVNDLLN